MASPAVAQATPKRGPSVGNTEGDKRAAKRTRDIRDFDNVITVLVGPKERRFIIHQEAVCDESKFFKAACSKRWTEGQEKLVRLPEVKAHLFKQYSNWIYSGAIPANTCTRESADQEKVNEKYSLIELYLLGDVLDDSRLRKVAIQALSESLRTGAGLPSPETLKIVWSSTPPGSLLRKLLVDFSVARVSRSHLIKMINTYSPEFVQELAAAALLKAPTASWKDSMGDASQFLEPEEPESLPLE